MSLPLLISVGYEGLSAPQFVDLMVGNKVHTLFDIRWVPRSRKPGFSKTQLKEALEDVGVSYIHEKTLGIPSAMRQNIKKGDALERVFKWYAKQLDSHTTLNAAMRVHERLKKHDRVAIMCMEKNPDKCHRSVLEKWLEENGTLDFITFHASP